MGDEFLYFGETTPVPYSIISTKPLLVYSISKEDFQNKLPKDIQLYFEENSINKCKWIEQRFIEILKNLNKLKDSYFEGISEKSNEIQKKFPRAASNALSNIRNKELLPYNLEQ